MDSLAPQDIDMIVESGDEAMEDALYRDDNDEDQLIVEETIDSTTTATTSVPAEVEMAPVDTGPVDDILEVEEEEEQEGGVDIEVLPTAGEDEVGGGGEDVAFEDAETDGGAEESSSKVNGGIVAGEEIVLEEEPSEERKEEEAEGSSSAAPAPSTEPSTTPVEPTSSSSILPASTSAPLSPDAESFVIVEAPSDSETNGKRGEGEERKDDEVEPVENEESTEEHIAGSQTDDASESVLRESETPSNYFSTNINTSDAGPSSSNPQAPHSSEPLPPSHYTNNGQGDDEEDTFSSYSDASSSHFPSDFFLSTIVTYPSNSSVPTSSPYSLFQPFADEAHEGPNLPVLLASNPDLFRAPLTELFDALREEGAFSVEDKALNMEDDGGTLEWVLEHENEGVALVIGEDNKHAVDFSLQDLAKLHSHCGLGAPMRLKLRTGPTRFLLRVNKIQEIRREMDEELGSEHAEENEGWVEEDSEHHEHIDEEEHFNSHHDHEELQGDGEMADEDLPEHELEVEQDPLEAAAVDDPADIADDDELPADDHPARAEPEQTDPEDYPNGPDDATAAQVSTIDDPASESIAEETEFTAQDHSEREPEPSIVEEATIVVTANEDIEIPSEAAPPSTDQGDFDTSAAGGLYDDDEEEEEDQTTHISDGPATEDVVDREEVGTIAEVQKAAADVSTSSEAVESVPVPPQFVVEDGESTVTDFNDVAPASEDLSAPSSTPAPSVSVPVVADAAASSSRRSTRLNPSSNAPSPAPAQANPAPSLEVPDELYGDGTDEADIYADSPLPSNPVEDHLEEVEPLGLHGEADEDQVRVEDDEEEEGGDSDHTLAESIEDLVQAVIEVDEDAADGSQTGGASPKRRFDELEKDDAAGEAVETIEVRDLKRHKAA